MPNHTQGELPLEVEGELPLNVNTPPTRKELLAEEIDERGDEEHTCPACGRGANDPTIMWSATAGKFRCISCGLVDTQRTAAMKRLIKRHAAL